MDRSLRELQELREKIDRLDRDLMKILRERFKLVEKIGRIKAKNELPVFQRARWAAMLADYKKKGKKYKLNTEFIQELMKHIHKESMRIQRKQRK